MLCKDGGLNEKLGICTQRDGNNSIYITNSCLLLWFVSEVQKPVNYLACIITTDPLLQY